MATRPQMGITQDASDRRAANNSSGNSRRIHHRTLLGLHFASQRLRRISSRASPMENLERDRLRIQRRRCNSLWRTICRNLKQASRIRIHCGRFTDYSSKAPATVGSLCLPGRSTGTAGQASRLGPIATASCAWARSLSQLSISAKRFETRIAAQEIEHWIETEQRRSERHVFRQWACARYRE